MVSSMGCRSLNRSWCSQASPRSLLDQVLIRRRVAEDRLPGVARERMKVNWRVISVKANLPQAAASTDLGGKTVVVLGVGASGRAAARLALARGASVVGLDSNLSALPLEGDESFRGFEESRIKTILGPFDGRILEDASLLVLSPGVPVALPVIAAAIDQGVPAVSELEFASQVIPPSIPIAAITGTNGKSTVTTFCGQLVSAAGVSAFVGGNLGTPLSSAALDFLTRPPTEPPYEAIVVEVSSYQMEILGQFRPRVAAILNLTPDHLERHKSMEVYAQMKCRLFTNMRPEDLAVIPRDDPLLRRLALAAGGSGTRAWIGGLPGVQLDSAARRAIISVPTTGAEARLTLDGLRTVGRHNAVNAASAALLAMALDARVTEEVVQAAIPSLAPPPHRMEPVCVDARGVLWVDDSKATNLEAAQAGVEGLGSRRAVILLGGIAKVGVAEGEGLGFRRLAPSLASHRALITFGASGEDIDRELAEAGVGIPRHRTKTMEEAVKLANTLTHPGDVVLLSPACASFDEFNNFMHRGQVFSKLVRAMVL